MMTKILRVGFIVLLIIFINKSYRFYLNVKILLI